MDAQAPKSKSSQKRRNRAIAAAQGDFSTNSKPTGSDSDNANKCEYIKACQFKKHG